MPKKSKSVALTARPRAVALVRTGAAELVAAFLAGRNARTLLAYRADLESFRAFVGAPTLDAAAAGLLGGSHGEANARGLAYRTHLVERGLQSATINRRLAALRSLVTLARTLGQVPWTLEVSNLKAERYRDTRGPGRAGVRLLLDALEDRPVARACRDRAAVRLLYDLGLRRGEVVALDVADVDLRAAVVQVLGKGKTAKAPLSLPAPTLAALRRWLELRGPAPGPLFVNFDRAAKGARLTGTSLYRIVRALGKDVGLEVRPHGLRHAAITDALDRTGGDVRKVQRFSRHRNLATLTIYDDNRTDLGGEVAQLVAGAL